MIIEHLVLPYAIIAFSLFFGVLLFVNSGQRKRQKELEERHKRIYEE